MEECSSEKEAWEPRGKAVTVEPDTIVNAESAVVSFCLSVLKGCLFPALIR